MWCRHPPRRRPKHFRRLKIRDRQRHATDVVCFMLPARRVAQTNMLNPHPRRTEHVLAQRKRAPRALTAEALLVRRGGLTCCKGLWWSVSLQDPYIQIALLRHSAYHIWFSRVRRCGHSNQKSEMLPSVIFLTSYSGTAQPRNSPYIRCRSKQIEVHASSLLRILDIST